MKIICSGCGTENPESANFCHHCGKALKDHGRPFQSSAWPELAIIASASAKASDTIHQTVDESGPPDAQLHSEPQSSLDSLQISAALQEVTKGTPERWSFAPIDVNAPPAPRPTPALDLKAEPPPQAVRAKIERPQDGSHTAHVPAEIDAVDSKFGWLESQHHEFLFVGRNRRRCVGNQI